MYPNNQHRHVDWQYPKHEDKHRVSVVVKVVVLRGLSMHGTFQCPDTRPDLHNAEYRVHELIGNAYGEQHSEQAKDCYPQRD